MEKKPTFTLEQLIKTLEDIKNKEPWRATQPVFLDGFHNYNEITSAQATLLVTISVKNN